MTLESRRFIVGAVVGIGLFFLTTHFLLKKNQEEIGEKEKTVKPENIETALRAYQAAFEKQEDQQTLNALNKQMKNEFGCTVSFDSLLNKYVVRDEKGKVIKSA